MASLAEHCATCKKLIGDGFTYVHEWLDEFAGQKPYGTRHRHVRHTKEGIEEVRRKWGDKAAEAAEIHIRQDLAEEGYPHDKPIPANSEEYKSIGLW